jgi:hypothetical protein
VLASALATLALAAPAQAACGGPVRSYPRNWHHHYRPPLVIGDSTMIFAVRYLGHLGMQADARGCRMWSEGLGILRQRLHAHTLPHLVVMALGANWIITRNDIEAAVRILGPKRVLGLVAPRETGGGTSSDAYNVRRAGRRHSNRVKVLDWPAFSSGHGYWFAGDGLHMNYSGANAYAHYIARLKKWAPWPKKPRRVRERRPAEEPAPPAPPQSTPPQPTGARHRPDARSDGARAS